MLTDSLVIRNMGEAARWYFTQGLHPVPLCWPDPSGLCGCGRGCTHVGKTPLVTLRDRIVTADDVAWWWKKWPYANIAFLLEPSGLVVYDIDGESSKYEALTKGLPATSVVRTRQGWHYVYRRHDMVPCTRKTRQGVYRAIDVLSTGISIAPPSKHKSGFVYRWEQLDIPTLPASPLWGFGPVRRVLMPKVSFQVTEDEAREAERVHRETNAAQLREVLRHIPEDSYQEWIVVGFALQQWDITTGKGEGFDLWDEWSRPGAKYPGRSVLAEKWKTFTREDVTLGTLFELAKRNGYVSPHDVSNTWWGKWGG